MKIVEVSTLKTPLRRLRRNRVLHYLLLKYQGDLKLVRRALLLGALGLPFAFTLIACLFLSLFGLPAGLFALPLSLWLLSLRRNIHRAATAARVNGFGAPYEWLELFSRPKAKIPWAFPADWPGRIKFAIVAASSFLLLLGSIVAMVFLLVVPGAILLALHLSTWRLVRRLGSTPSSIALRKDKRPPVLLLRSFLDDDIRFPAPFFSLQIGRSYRFEEQLAFDLWREGPVIAIGKPGEKLPHFGACREYHTDDTWRGRVLELIPQSHCIAMIAGLTDGLSWEVNQLRNGGALHKTVFIIPPMDREILESRVGRLLSQLGEPIGAEEFMGHGRHLICLGFSDSNELIAVFSDQRFTFDYGVALHALLTLQITVPAAPHRPAVASGGLSAPSPKTAVEPPPLIAAGTRELARMCRIFSWLNGIAIAGGVFFHAVALQRVATLSQAAPLDAPPSMLLALHAASYVAFLSLGLYRLTLCCRAVRAYRRHEAKAVMEIGTHLAQVWLFTWIAMSLTFIAGFVIAAAIDNQAAGFGLVSLPAFFFHGVAWLWLRPLVRDAQAEFPVWRKNRRESRSSSRPEYRGVKHFFLCVLGACCLLGAGYFLVRRSVPEQEIAPALPPVDPALSTP